MYNPLNIKIRMAAQSLTVADVSRKAGLTETTVRQVLRGCDIKTSTLEKVAISLSCTEVDFYLPIPTSLLVTA